MKRHRTSPSHHADTTQQETNTIPASSNAPSGNHTGKKRRDPINRQYELVFNALSAAAQEPTTENIRLLGQVQVKAWMQKEYRNIRDDICKLARTCVPGTHEFLSWQRQILDYVGMDGDPPSLGYYVTSLNAALRKFERECRITEFDPEDFIACRCTDVANGHRIAKHFQGMILHNTAYGWLFWCETHWRRDEKAVRELVHRLPSTIRTEIKLLAEDMDLEDKAELERFQAFSKALIKWAKYCGSRKAIDAAMKEASALPETNADHIEFDADQWFFNTVSDTVDLRSGEKLWHDPKHYITKVCPTGYTPEALCPKWLAHLKKVFDSNQNLIDYFQFLCGYALSGSMKHQLFVICHGPSGCGKSTTLETVMHVMGADYATAVSHEVVLDQRNPPHSTVIASLAGVRFGLASELPKDARWNESNIKRLAAGDTMTARFCGRDGFNFSSSIKLFVNCNDRPNFNDRSGAMERRIVCIPFNVNLCGEDRDRDIDSALRSEREGILKWMVEGAKIASEREPERPACVRIDIETYVQENDTVAQFLADCCKVSANAKASKKASFDAYKEWGGDGSQRYLGSLLKERFGESSDGQTRYWTGFELRS